MVTEKKLASKTSKKKAPVKKSAVKNHLLAKELHKKVKALSLALHWILKED